MSWKKGLRFGIDVGGTKIACGLVRATGRLVTGGEFPTPRPAEPLPLLARLARELAFQLESSRLSLTSVEVVGMGFPADFEPATHRVLTAPNLPLFVGEKPRELLARVLGEQLGYRGRVLVGNDASAAALAEGHWGAGRQLADFLYVTVSTGVGGARFFRRPQGLEALNVEPGKHTFPDPSRSGECLDRLASGAALARRVREELMELLAEGGEEALRRRTRLVAGFQGTGEKLRAYLGTLDVRELSRAASAGDGFSRRWLEHSADLVGTALVQLVIAAGEGPEPIRKIVVGGSIALKVPGFLDRIRHRLAARQELTALGFRGDQDLLAATLGDERGVLGATLLAEASAT